MASVAIVMLRVVKGRVGSWVEVGVGWKWGGERKQVCHLTGACAALPDMWRLVVWTLAGHALSAYFSGPVCLIRCLSSIYNCAELPVRGDRNETR